MKEFILLRKGKNESWNNLPQEKQKKIMNEFSDFVLNLDQQGILKDGYSLNHQGIQRQ